jgi:uncharacterized membrane protein
MTIIKPKIQPLNVAKKLNNLLKQFRDKNKLYTVKDYARYSRLVRLNEMKRSHQRRENIYTYLTLWVFCIAIMLMAYGSLYVINYLMML